MPEHHHGANAWHVAAIAVVLGTLLVALAIGGWRLDDILRLWGVPV